MYLPRLFAVQTSLRVYTKAVCSKDLQQERPGEKCLPTCHGDKNRGARCLQIPGLVISALHSVVYLILGRVCYYYHLAEDHDSPGWQTIHGRPGNTQAWVLNGEVAWVCLLWKGLW